MLSIRWDAPHWALFTMTTLAMLATSLLAFGDSQ